MRLLTVILIVAALFTAIIAPAETFAKSGDEDGSASAGNFQATGLNEPTAEQAKWIKDNFPVIQKIRLNDLAVERINADRENKGLSKLAGIFLDYLDIAPIGDEAVIGTSDGTSGGTTSVLAGALPDSVDNSTSAAFPPIRSQGGIGSCVAWAITYYQFTYETNLALGRTASGGDNNVIFSPKWTYNLINGGVDAGSYFSDAYAVEMKNGAASWAAFPYDTNYLQWPLNASTWRNAINYRPQSYGQIYNSNTDTLIESMKTQLTNGHVLVIATYVSSWSQGVLSDPDTTQTTIEDALVGQKIATYMKNTNLGGHGMTVVGYNNNLWTDLNGNGVVDIGEKGAFKIANSWGAGDWNRGYRWVAYDALRGTSSVSASGTWPTTDRSSSGIFRSGNIFTLTVRSSYTPSVVAEVTLNAAKRGQLVFSLGTGSTAGTTPSSTWSSKALNYTGGNYAFNGTTTTCDGTFVFDFSDLAASISGTTRWFAGLYDNKTGDAATLKAYNLYNVTAGGDVLLASADNVPASVDAGQIYRWVDSALDPSNQPPVANAGPDQTATVGQVVTFNGSGSLDPDGSINSYEWTFGDGTFGTGAIVTHPYGAAATYTVTLTVTDNGGLIDTDTAIVTVTEPVSGDTMHVSSISVKSATKKAGKNTFYLATAVVTVVDGNGLQIDGVTVSGHWTGLTTDTDTSITGVDGKVSLTSDSTKKKTGVFTFNVDDLVKSGWTYDSANSVTSGSVSIP